MQPERQEIIARTHWLGILSNAGLAAVKLGVGALAGSRALLADGVHGLSDVAMNLGAWVGWRLASRPRDSDHHYGHGNIEALTTVGVGLVVVTAGIGLGWTALHGQSTVGPDALGLAAVAVELVSVAIKVGLARVTGRRGRELDSPILVAISRDNAADVLTSALVMIAIIAAILGLRWLEPAAAVIIGVIIAWHGLRSAREGLDVLMDRVSDPGLAAEIVGIAARVPGVRSVDDVRVHPLGTHLRADLEISVDGTIEVHEGHAIAHEVERAVTEASARVHEVSVHVNPVSEPAQDLPAADH
ncbi:putative cation efflux system protein [Enhygromyxa salina]|uniref:Putative cation efflux system protein n=1 Tax=Enhygromyxa salina TaxID=215803 RepID=A0A2S9YBA5_9BACT|nr:cation diffusion facilitator family transporter [Enhygromyxa salina]PRQ02390.1 putative cation efflux system protein [Enhygromyxa salina]